MDEGQRRLQPLSRTRAVQSRGLSGLKENPLITASQSLLQTWNDYYSMLTSVHWSASKSRAVYLTWRDLIGIPPTHSLSLQQHASSAPPLFLLSRKPIFSSLRALIACYTTVHVNYAFKLHNGLSCSVS